MQDQWRSVPSRSSSSHRVSSLRIISDTVPRAAMSAMSEEESITDSTDWTAGDVIIISSDRVRFRVPSNTLKWAW